VLGRVSRNSGPAIGVTERKEELRAVLDDDADRMRRIRARRSDSGCPTGFSVWLALGNTSAGGFLQLAKAATRQTPAFYPAGSLPARKSPKETSTVNPTAG
jgi:hypothetical protein